jgi:hypothetical protein
VRPISGFDRPAIQWLFAFCGVALIATCVATGVAVVRMRRTVEESRREAAQARNDRQQVEASLARERSTREALRLELGRERTAAAPQLPPTLTLEPVKGRSPRGPEIAVPQTTAPVVELRLLLPPGTPDGPFTVTTRSWSTGVVAWVRAGLSAGVADRRPAIVIPITSDVLAPGPYEIVLSAGLPSKDVTTYEYSVVPTGTKPASK